MQEESIQDSWPKEGTHCWGCGKNNEHRLQLKSYWDDDETTATWTPKEHHLAFPGVLNGGIISTIIDCHGTGTANAYHHRNQKSSNHHMHVTASLKINFLRPTPLDKPVTLKARVSETDGKRTVVDCELFSEDVRCVQGEVVTIRVDYRNFLKTH
jgi:acyl-coenzyme A thioesterase PaaI-like protein